MEIIGTVEGGAFGDPVLKRLRYQASCAEAINAFTPEQLAVKVHAVSGELNTWIDQASHAAMNQDHVDQLAALSEVMEQFDSVVAEHFPLPFVEPIQPE